MRTPPLRPGEKVAVVAASGPVETEGLERGIAWLRERYRVDDDHRRVARTGYFAGTDDDRCAALLESVRDPSVRAVYAARGGYGAMRVLERVGGALRSALERDPKPLVGYSDVTALHALWSQLGLRSVHAPMVAAIGRNAVSDGDRDAVMPVVEGAAAEAWSGLEVWISGEARGRVAGGNLALLTALVGTPYAMPLDGAVLFLEDITEKPYRVDRMLTTLRLAGALRGMRAVVLGDFTECEPVATDGVTVEQVLRERLGDLGIPVVANAPFGHGARQRCFALGDEAIVSRNGSVEFIAAGP